MSTRDEIDESVRALLEEGTSKQSWISKVRVPNPTLPYSVVHPMNTSGGKGGFEDEMDEKDYIFQITCVGKDPRQAAAMSSSVEAVLTAKKPGGGYVHPMELTGHAVQWRLLESSGAIVPSGESLYRSDDTYSLRIGKET